jgi:hypothetical protein
VAGSGEEGFEAGEFYELFKVYGLKLNSGKKLAISETGGESIF